MYDALQLCAPWNVDTVVAEWSRQVYRQHQPTMAVCATVLVLLLPWAALDECTPLIPWCGWPELLGGYFIRVQGL